MPKFVSKYRSGSVVRTSVFVVIISYKLIVKMQLGFALSSMTISIKE